MARVQIDQIVTNSTGATIPNASVAITSVNGFNPVTVYQSNTGASTYPLPLTSGADGSIPGFLAIDTYQFAITPPGGSTYFVQIDAATGTYKASSLPTASAEWEGIILTLHNTSNSYICQFSGGTYQWNRLSFVTSTPVNAFSSDVFAQAGISTQVAIGNQGPSAQSGISFQDEESFIYRSQANRLASSVLFEFVQGIKVDTNHISTGANDIWTGTGAPGVFGSDGDFYFRSDGATPTIYQHRGGSWFGVDGNSTYAKDVIARAGLGTQVTIGNAGPASQSGVAFQSGEEFLYRSAANTLQSSAIITQTNNLFATPRVQAPYIASSGIPGFTSAGQYVGAVINGATPTTGTWNNNDWLTDTVGRIFVFSGGSWNTAAGAGGGSGGGGSVSSVFSRTGAVAAQSGDYTAAQVTNAPDLSSTGAQVFNGRVHAPWFTATPGFSGSTGTSRWVGSFLPSATPGSGTFQAGDFGTGISGMAVCITGGSPGTWQVPGPASAGSSNYLLFSGTASGIVPGGAGVVAGTWTPSVSQYVHARVTGAGSGGGGGGSALTSGGVANQMGGAGGTAGCVIDLWFFATAGTTYQMVLSGGGAGGSGAAANGNAGGQGAAGNDTAIYTGGWPAGTAVVYAIGALPGNAVGANTVTLAQPSLWGTGSAATSGTAAWPGSGGASGNNTPSATMGVVGGAGGGVATTTKGGGAGGAQQSGVALLNANAPGSFGSAPTTAGIVGQAATLDGCGGGGGGAGAPGGAGAAGGAGAPGKIELWFVGQATVWAPRTHRIEHTFALAGGVATPAAGVGDANWIPPMFVSLGASETKKLVKARYMIGSGNIVTGKLQKNNVDITGFTGFNITPTPTSVTPTGVSLAEDDRINLVLTGVLATPANGLAVTIAIESTVS